MEIQVKIVLYIHLFSFSGF